MVSNIFVSFEAGCPESSLSILLIAYIHRKDHISSRQMSHIMQSVPNTFGACVLPYACAPNTSCVVNGELIYTGTNCIAPWITVDKLKLSDAHKTRQHRVQYELWTQKGSLLDIRRSRIPLLCILWITYLFLYIDICSTVSELLHYL